MKITIRAEDVSIMSRTSAENIKTDLVVAERRIPEIKKMSNEKKDGADEAMVALVNGIRKARECLSIAEDIHNKSRLLPKDCIVELQDNEILSLSFPR